jgi:uncharacterized membrane protein
VAGVSPSTSATSVTGQAARIARDRHRLAALMLGSGTLHLVAGKPYEKVVPRSLGDARRVVVISGVAELACGTLLLNRRTSRLGALLTAALLVAVFPANVQMVVDAGTEHQAIPTMPEKGFRALALARLPLQIPLVARALRIARATT